MKNGYAAIFTTIVVLVVIFGIIISIVVLSTTEYKILKNTAQSAQAYYAAEAGIEDALLKLTKSIGFSNNYTINVGSSTAAINTSETIGGTIVITSTGNANNQIRKVEAVYAIDADGVSFYYGAQAGDGGINMGSNARIIGNVFSNATVFASSGTGYINNSIIVAGSGNKIEKLDVGEDAQVHTCKDSNIDRDLTYVSGGSVVNCQVEGITKNQPNEIEPKNLPISLNQINEWKTEANSGGILNENYVLADNKSGSLGPVQIGTASEPKNMTIGSNSVLTLTGTVYVTGDIIINNNAVVKLSPSYGPLGGVLITDGKINIYNNVEFRGSGQEGSYLLALSTNHSLDPASPAIDLNNNVRGAIFYTNAGLIHLHNNVGIKEITGYQLQLDNNAVITYETGLANALFSSGPGGGWEIVSWREIE